MDVLASISERLGKLVSDKITLRAMRKEDLQTFLRNNIEGHRRMVMCLSAQSDKVWGQWYSTTLKMALQKSSSAARTVPEAYRRRVGGKAAQYERTRPLYSLLKANEAYADVLESISKKIDTLMKEEAITVKEVRLSQLAILGILRQSDIVMNFTMYLYAFIVRAASRNATGIPRYREMYLLDKQDQVSDIVTALCDKRGPYTFLSEVQSLRSKQADLVLGATGTFNVPTGALLHRFSISFLDNLASAWSCLNIFGAMLDAWDDYKLERYERDKEIKSWLEQHTALLRLDLEEMDKTSPTYQETLMIITAYDQKIAEYDQKITEFEKED